MQWRNLNRRPTGITVIFIINIVSGISWIFIDLGTIGTAMDPFFPVFVSPMLITLTTIHLFLSIGLLIVSYGLYVGKGWSWEAIIGIQIINILFAIINLNAAGLGVTLVISGIVIYYMIKPTTRAYFGKVKLDI